MFHPLYQDGLVEDQVKGLSCRRMVICDDGADGAAVVGFTNTAIITGDSDGLVEVLDDERRFISDDTLVGMTIEFALKVLPRMMECTIQLS